MIFARRSRESRLSRTALVLGAFVMLWHALLPSLHAVQCTGHGDMADHGHSHGHPAEAAASVLALDGTDALDGTLEHECGVCRILSNSGSLTSENGIRVEATLQGDFVAHADAHVPAWAPLRDDLGRAPPAHTR